jgi:hypothetical protein
MGCGALVFGVLGIGAAAWWMLRGSSDSSGSDPVADGFEGAPGAPVGAGAGSAGAVAISSASASSNLPSTNIEGIFYTFGADNVVDGNLGTSWQPRRNDGSPSVRLSYAPARVTELRIANGFQHVDSNGDLFVSNRRVSSLLVTTSSGFRQSLRVPDARGWSTLRVEESSPSEWMELRVEGTHADARRWPDVAISDVELVGVR